MVQKILYLAMIFLLSILLAGVSSAAPADEYKITYLINVKENGDAIWNVEYRTVLSTTEDFDSFEDYKQQLNSVYLNEFRELMQNSASEASVATSRIMVARDFTGNAVVQSTPTGSYGVVRYAFTWTNFARTEQDIIVGDVFFGGLYLSRDNTLIIKYPGGYEIYQATPEPDLIRDGLVWYGLRSFGPDEPQVVLTKTSFSWSTFVIIIFIIGAGAFFIYMRKIRRPAPIKETDILDLEDRIVKLLKESGGSLHQSEIGRRLNLPKSTVSSTLNELYSKNIIQKIKKGRENLIRLL